MLVHKVNLYFGIIFIIVTCSVVLIISTLFYLGFFIVDYKVYKNNNKFQKLSTRIAISHVEALEEKRHRPKRYAFEKELEKVIMQESKR